MIAITFSAYLVLVGLLAGSFINLAADRLPRGESIVRPGSHCRACGRRLNVVDLIPVLGYVVRGGRCATCRASIGMSSPIVEATSGTAMLLPLIFLGFARGALLGALLVALLGTAAVGVAFARERVRP
jgi:prepilin signal peptidase PulO-like enzyme (type II secretory pathway)